MDVRTLGLAAATAALVAGCSVTEPVVVIAPNGQMLRGTTHANLLHGSFQVTDGTLTCGGSYSSLSMETTINIPVLCSDGRKGFVIANRDSTGRSGQGTVHLTDGMQATFIFGPAARNF